ncbi:MAG TPA: MFS transporter [Thermoguttaceae bacterium]|nr:MFS transporter [Thermoguttaceae bacterium]
MSNLDENPRRATRTEVFAWALYDWAESAYSTLSITILLLYIQLISPPNWGPVVWAWGISLSMLVAAVLSPIIGAMADARRNKRTWLAATALGGAVACVLMAALPSTATWPIIGLFVLASLAYEIAHGVYNGFLPEIADQKTMNRVSAWGYALGYPGGAFALVVAIVLMKQGAAIGLPDEPSQLRAGILVMGLWWGLFALPTLLIVRDRGPRPEQRPPLGVIVAGAVSEVGRTLRNVRRYRMLAWFLLGFLLYNDGIQTVLTQASLFAKDVLAFKPEELISLILMIQFVALPGAMTVGWLADWFGQKRVLMGCLAVWVALVTVAFFITTKSQFWILGIVLALVMGGTQSVSRAIMGAMTPAARTAEFFGFFNLSGKATSFLGTFLFGAIIATGNSADWPASRSTRWAVLSLLVFFVLGWLIAGRINVAQGRREAENTP